MADTPNAPDTCAGCRYFHPQPGAAAGIPGACFRYPPVPLVIGQVNKLTRQLDQQIVMQYAMAMPAAAACGEFATREPMMVLKDN